MLKIYRNKENNFTSFIEPSFKKLFQLYEKSCLYSRLLFYWLPVAPDDWRTELVS